MKRQNITNPDYQRIQNSNDNKKRKINYSKYSEESTSNEQLGNGHESKYSSQKTNDLDQSNELTSDQSDSLVINESTYIVGNAPVKTTSQGNIYQLKVLMYYMAKASKNKIQFQLATEMSNCGKLDDVIFFYNDRKNHDTNKEGFFIQVKHKAKTKDKPHQINYKNLLSLSMNESFSLVKYFVSFIEIEQNIKLKDIKKKRLFLFTNTQVNDANSASALECILENVRKDYFKDLPLFDDPSGMFVDACFHKIILDQSILKQLVHLYILKGLPENILKSNEYSESFQKYCTYIFKNIKKYDMEPLLDEELTYKQDWKELKTVIQNEKIQKNKAWKKYALMLIDLIIDDRLHSYLSGFDFYFVTKLPDGPEFDKIIYNAIDKKYNFIDREYLCDSFFIKALEWLKGYDEKVKTCKYMTKRNLETIFNDIYKTYNNCLVTGMSLALEPNFIHNSIKFNTDQIEIAGKIKDFLNDNGSGKFYMKSSDKLEICSAIVYQCILETERFVTNKIFVPLREIMNNEEVINKIVDTSRKQNGLLLYILICFNVNDTIEINLFNRLYKSLKSKKVILIAKEHQPFLKCFDNGSVESYNFKFKDIKNESDFLNRNISLQGKDIKIKDIMDYHIAGEVISSHVLIKIINNEFFIGKDDDFTNPEHKDFLKNIYIKRTLSHQTIGLEKILNFDDEMWENNLLLLTGCNDELDSIRSQFQTINDTIKISTLQLDHSGNRGYDEPGIVLCINKIDSLQWKSFLTSANVSNIHWFSFNRSPNQDNVIEWKASKGDLSPIQTLMDNCETERQNLKESDIVENYKTRQQNIYLISNSQGSGKTLLLGQIGEKIKNNYPYYWIIRIDLKQFTDHKKDCSLNNISYSDLNTVEYISNSDRHNIECMIKMYLLSKMPKVDTNSYEYQLLKLLLLENTNISVRLLFLIDGFDEIVPSYKDKTKILVKAIIKCKIASVIITTRHSERTFLENELQTPSLSLDLFTEEDQLEFFSKACQNEPNQIKILKEKLHSVNAAHENKYFSRVPLHLYMLTEIFLSGISSDSLDLLKLYDLCINNKWKQFDREKSLGDIGNQPQQVKDIVYKNLINKIHGELSFQEIFPTKTSLKKNCKIYKTLKNQLKVYNDFRELLEQHNRDGIHEVTRFGLISLNAETNVPLFYHRSFAEYFVSRHLVQNEEIFFKTFTLIINDKNNLYFLVRKFLNLRLRQDSNKHIYDSYVNKIKTNRKIKSFQKLFHLLELGATDTVIELLNDFRETQHNLTLLLIDYVYEANILYKAVKMNEKKIFLSILQCITANSKNLSVKNFKEIITYGFPINYFKQDSKRGKILIEILEELNKIEDKKFIGEIKLYISGSLRFIRNEKLVDSMISIIKTNPDLRDIMPSLNTLKQSIRDSKR